MTRERCCTRNLCLALAAVACIALPGFVSPQPVQAKDALRLELDELAKDIHALIRKKGEGPVSVGGFGEPANALGSSSPSIQLQLGEALQEQGLKLKTDGFQYQVSGTYLGAVDSKTDALGVRILAIVSNANGIPLQTFPREVFGEETVPRLFGLNVRTNPNDNPVKRHQKFREALKKPQVHIDGTRVRTAADSPYAVEVLVKTDSGAGDSVSNRSFSGYDVQRPTPDRDRKGLPFVPVKRGQVFAVRLTNDSPHDAAVALSIDGINVFEFSEVKGTYWIIPPRSSVTVPGWHRNHETSTEFKVTDFPSTAAARLNLKPSRTIGTISAAFSAAWESDADKPADEASGRGAGFGEDVKFSTRRVRRTIGHVRDHVVVRYERPSAD